MSHKIKEITYSKSITIQMRDYEPAKAHVSATVELTEDTPESRQAAYSDVKAYVQAQMQDEQKAFYETRKKLRELEAKQAVITQQNEIANDPLLQATAQAQQGTEEGVIYLDDDGNQLDGVDVSDLQVVDSQGNEPPFVGNEFSAGR